MTPASAASVDAPPTCPRCGTVNSPGMNFCKMCGTSLPSRAPEPEAPPPVEATAAPAPVAAAPASVAPAPAPVAAAPAPAVVAAPAPIAAAQVTAAAGPTSTAPVPKLTCFSCNKQTPAGFAFCQSCGTRLATTSAAMPVATHSARSSRSDRIAAASPAMPSPAPSPTPTPPPVSSQAPTTARTTEPIRRAPESTTTVRVGDTFPQSRTELAQGRPERSDGNGVRPHPTPSPRLEAKPVARTAPPHSRLVFLKEGVAGDAHPIASDTFDVGRTDGNLVIGADPHLAPRHARLVFAGGVVKIRSLDGTNGVYLRLREPHELSPGDQLLVGRQLLRFETLSPEERDPPSLVELGVRLLGSPSREAWGRLRQITSAGTTRDVFHLARPEVVLGRSEGDILFPDDDLVAPRHAVLRRGGNKSRIEDLGYSAAGTFVRLRGERELRSGDVLRLGEQVLRFETLG